MLQPRARARRHREKRQAADGSSGAGGKWEPAALVLWYARLMRRDEAIRRLRTRQADLERLGVQHLYLFGSTARDEAKPESDVDLFFDHPEGSLGLLQLLKIKDATADILGHKADVITRRSLHPVLKARIEASALQVF